MKHNLLSTALAVGLALAVVGGCGKKDDPITKAEKKDADKPGQAWGQAFVMRY